MLLKYLYKNKRNYIIYFIYLYKKEKLLFYCKIKSMLRECDTKAYSLVLSIILKFVAAYKKMLIVCNSIKVYKIAYGLYLNIINIIKEILHFVIFILNKFKNKIKLFIMHRCRLALGLFSGSSMFYLLFFFLINIIEYLAYLIKKNYKKKL
jgi:hypothetical protein